MNKQNVLYFTSYPLDKPSHGGAIAILNDISELSQIESINLYVVIACQKANQVNVSSQLDKLNVKYHFAPLRPTLNQENWWRKLTILLKYNIRLYFNFWYEIETRYYNHADYVSTYLSNLCEKLSIQTVIVEHLYSILWFKDFLKLKQNKIYLALDKEAKMFKSFRKYENPRFSQFRIFISYLRLSFFEKKVCSLADKCIFMSKADIPRNLTSNKKVFINSQALPSKLVSWHYSNSETLLFTGNINHYPNFLAIQWLIDKLSPTLLKLNNKIKIIITGTNLHDIPKNWVIRSNVHIVGFIPQEELKELFQTSDMFICPIDNDFSVKMKLVECVSYGTPFFATEPCLKALPYLSGLPILDINKPDEAASYICDTLSQKEVLDKLNQNILEKAFNFRNTRKEWWEKSVLNF